MFPRSFSSFNGPRSSTFPSVNIKLRISSLSLIIRCDLNLKNHSVEDHSFRAANAVRFVAIPSFLIIDHIFFFLQCKFLAKIIGYIINLCNFRLRKYSNYRLNVIISHYKFNDFAAMLLIISKIYLSLSRNYVNIT